MSDPELTAMSYPELRQERARLQQRIRDLRHTMEHAGHAMDLLGYAAMQRIDDVLKHDLGDVISELRSRSLTAGGAR